MGALTADYLLSQKQAKGTLPYNGVVIKTIVTSEIREENCLIIPITYLDGLTGFKFIGEKINEYESIG